MDDKTDSSVQDGPSAKSAEGKSDRAPKKVTRRAKRERVLRAYFPEKVKLDGITLDQFTHGEKNKKDITMYYMRDEGTFLFVSKARTPQCGLDRKKPNKRVINRYS